MSIEEKLVKVAQEQIEVYDRGKEDGVKSEYDRFWDAYQDYGNRKIWVCAFGGNGWTDKTYNPKYAIIANPGGSVTSMYFGTSITDTRVTLNFKGVTTNTIFSWAESLTTIRLIIVDKDTLYNVWFNECTKLANINFDGIIGNNIDLHWSPLLTVQSLLSILTALSKSPETATAKTATFALVSQAKINADSDCTTQYNAALAAGWTIAFI